MTRKMRKAIALSALALILTAGASRGSAAVDIFLNVDGAPADPDTSKTPPPDFATILGLVLTLVP